MEIKEIKDLWKEEGKRITENVKVNKDASLTKLRSSFNKIRIVQLFRLVFNSLSVPLIIVLIIFPKMKNDNSILFYVALASFLLLIFYAFFIQIYYNISLLKIDFSKSLVKTQKEILHLELFEKRLNILGLFFVPIAVLSMFKIFNFSFNQEQIIMTVLIVLILFISFIAKMKYLIPKKYGELNTYLDDIEKNEDC
jgi:hypothetical protein